MSDATPSRVGQIQGSGDPTALFLKVFSGEILTAYHANVLMKDKHRVRAIANGKSAQFPATFKVGTQYHTPGTEILGEQIQSNEVVITLDNFLISDVFIADIDEAMSHFDFRSIYSNEMGIALALAYDRNVMRNVLLSSRASGLFTGDSGGGNLTNASLGTDGAYLSGALFTAKETLENKLVPVNTTPVYAGFLSAQWYLIAQTEKIVNSLYNGGGSNSKGTFTSVAGVEVVKSTAFPFGLNDTVYDGSTNTTGTVGAPSGANALEADFPTKYQLNMTTTVGAVWTEAAAATLQLRDLSMQSAYDIRRGGTLMVSRYAVGHGPLRSKCALELKTS